MLEASAVVPENAFIFRIAPKLHLYIVCPLSSEDTTDINRTSLNTVF